MKTALMLASLSLLGTAAAHATATPEGFENDARLGEEADRICFIRSIDGFSDPTQTTVVVEARANDFYLIETRGTCRELEYAKSIAFDPSQSCVRRNDRFAVSDSFFGMSGRVGGGSCRVANIYEWHPDAAEADTTEDSTAAEQ